MLLEPFWAALRFVQREDTISFHAKLFHCFLLGVLDANSDLAILSHRLERIWALLSRRLVDAGFMRDATHLHDPVSSPGRNDTTIRCPPRRRYEAMLLQISGDPLTSPTAPFVFSHPINFIHGLSAEPISPAVAFNPPGSERAPGGYSRPPAGFGFVLLGLLMLVVLSRSAIGGSGSVRAMFRLLRVAVALTANLGEWVIRLFPQGYDLSMDEAAGKQIAGVPDDGGHQPPISIPGAWLYTCHEQSVLGPLEESRFGVMAWMLRSCVQMGMKVWVQLFDLTWDIGTLNPWNRGSNDVVTIERKSEDDISPVRQGCDVGISVSTVLGGCEQQDAAQDRLPSLSRLSLKSARRSTLAILGRRFEPMAAGDIVAKDLEVTQTTTLDVVHKNTTGIALMTLSSMDRLLCREDLSSDAGESTSEDRSDDTEEGLFDSTAQRADISASKGKDECRVFGRRQDGALSDTGSQPSLRRVYSGGYLWQGRDIFDDVGGTGDDSYWTEQVNARLSGERDLRHAPCRYGWEGREDGTNSWRIRSSQVTHITAPEKANDAACCQADRDNTSLHRYSSSPLDVDTSLPHGAGNGDGGQGIYVVPQKRGRNMATQCWSPVSSPRPFDHSSGLGFFPFRRTPSLLTPEAWRPGCLYIPDPPKDEGKQADAWWDSLNSGGDCGSAAERGHGSGTGTVIRGVTEQGYPFARDGPDVSVSWRDRYENDPASRRFFSVHRRAMTEG